MTGSEDTVWNPIGRDHFKLFQICSKIHQIVLMFHGKILIEMDERRAFSQMRRIQSSLCVTVSLCGVHTRRVGDVHIDATIR